MSLSLWFTIGLVWCGELIITSVGEPEPREKKISGSGAGGKKKCLAPRHCPSLWFFFDDMRGRGSIGLREVDELLEELLWVEVVGWGVVGSGEFYVLFRVLWLVGAVQGEGVCFVAGRFLGGLLFDEVILPV